MANISKITVNSTDYDVKDALSRDHLAWYGLCETNANVAVKAVSCSNYALKTGSTIDVKFTKTNTVAVGSLKLSVNGTAEKAIKYRGSNLPSAGTLAAGRVYRFIYDGTNYELVGDLDTNSSAVSSVNGKTGAVTLTYSDVNAVASNQGTGNAGKFLVVNSSGIVEPVEMTAWQGGSY